MTDTGPQQPAPGGTALLIIDMINDMDFSEGGEMLAHATAATDAIERLRDQAARRGVPIVYVNDNYGQWHSERSRIIEYCTRPESRGRDLIRRIEPAEDDYFVIKPQFSGFYSTNLPVLLPKLGVSRLILTGLAADMCVLFTAADAHMRDYELWVPADAVASTEQQRADWALDIMAKAMGAEIRPTTELSVDDWVSAAGGADA
ncbi:MAG: cysteine hydrolase [Sphingomonas bacterium]|nr:cysteine hydrolase [Sphingomonas bacterium]